MFFVFATTLAQVSGRGWAQTVPAYPAKPVRSVLAFGAPGGAPDTIASYTLRFRRGR